MTIFQSSSDMSNMFEIFHEPTLNAFMSMGRKAWKETRLKISEILSEDNPTLRDNEELKNVALRVLLNG